MSDEDTVEKAGCVAGAISAVLWIVGLFFIYKGGYWLGGRWYHWIFAMMIVGVVEQILNKIVGAVVKAVLSQKK